MEAEITLRDIADDLLILNKYTIDTLFKLDNCADCIALYVLYYKTAKWQKTNTIKANDLYVKKVLKWGIDRIKRTKQTLKEHGLINIVQRRKDGKIAGWYIEVSYLVTQRKEEDIRIKVVESNNTQNQHVENSTCGNEETNALKQQIIALKNENKMLKNKNNNDQPAKPADSELAAEFEELWRHVGKLDLLPKQAIELVPQSLSDKTKKQHGHTIHYIISQEVKHEKISVFLLIRFTHCKHRIYKCLHPYFVYRRCSRNPER